MRAWAPGQGAAGPFLLGKLRRAPTRRMIEAIVPIADLNASLFSGDLPAPGLTLQMRRSQRWTPSTLRKSSASSGPSPPGPSPATTATASSGFVVLVSQISVF